MDMYRYSRLLHRFLAARKLGFRFVGTTRSNAPKRVTLGGTSISLTYPPDSGYLLDIINLWLSDEYGLGKIKHPVTSIVDIGGNIGLFSLWAWHHFPNARILTYEPNPRVFDFLSENLAPTRAVPHLVGVASKPGRAVMNDLSNSRTASTTPASSGQIRLITLSQIVEEAGGSIDILKMDCEGAEWDIFHDKQAFASIKAIRMEYHLVDHHSLDELVSVTSDLGYTMVHHIPDQGFGIAWFEKR